MIALKSLQVMESPGTFEVFLDMKGESLREAVSEGEYDLVDEMVREDFNFSGLVIPKRRTARIELLGFKYDLRPENVSRKIHSLGYRPAKVIEFAKLGAWYPQLQFIYQIFCWSGFDRFNRGLHHTLFIDSFTSFSERMRILGAHDILKGLPAFSRIACVRLNGDTPS